MKYLLVAAVLGVVLISGCVGQVACEAPAVTIGSKCCIDANSNKICDTDETQQKAEQPSILAKCGDGTCSTGEGCSYDSTNIKYTPKCSQDCGQACPAYIILTTGSLESEKKYSYSCTGYADGVCTATADGKFTIKNQIGPYKDTPERGFVTIIKNIGGADAKNIKSSFKCYRESEIVLSKDEDSYRGLDARDYFWDYVMKVQSAETLQPYAQNAKYYKYYLHFDIAKLEEDMVLKCSVALSADGGWSNVQELEITFLK